jgi:hypothetical protein
MAVFELYKYKQNNKLCASMKRCYHPDELRFLSADLCSDVDEHSIEFWKTKRK